MRHLFFLTEREFSDCTVIDYGTTPATSVEQAQRKLAGQSKIEGQTARRIIGIQTAVLPSLVLYRSKISPFRTPCSTEEQPM